MSPFSVVDNAQATLTFLGLPTPERLGSANFAGNEHAIQRNNNAPKIAPAPIDSTQAASG
jgi:hypothetical protein